MDIPIEKPILPRISRSDPNEEGPRYHNIAMSSGGFKGFAQLGALKRLAEAGLIDVKRLKAVAGVSVGAILGMMLIIGMTPDEIWKLFYELDAEEYLDLDPLMIFEKGGATTGAKIYNLIERTLREKTGIRHITFAQLYEITKVHFIVVGSSLARKVAVYYDHIFHPNFKVSLAIRVSFGVPVVFTPIDVDGDFQLDGAVCDSYPIEIFKEDMDRTVGILTYETFSTEFNNVLKYLFALAMLALDQHFRRARELYPENTIQIGDNNSTSVTTGRIDNKDKEILYLAGVEAADRFICQLDV